MLLLIYVKKIVPLSEEERRTAMDALPAWRRERALSCKREEDACRSLSCGELFVQGCRDLGWDPEEVFFSGEGKPLFRQKGRYFSLSHAKCLAAAAFSDGPVGADAEEIARFMPKGAPHEKEEILSKEGGRAADEAAQNQIKPDAGHPYGREKMLRQLAEKILTEEEKDLFRNLPPQERPCALCRIWTAKEACAKRIGCGIAADFSRFDTASDEGLISQKLTAGYWLSVSVETDGGEISPVFCGLDAANFGESFS